MASEKSSRDVDVLKEGMENAKVYDLSWEAAKEERKHRFQVEKVIVYSLTACLFLTLISSQVLNFIPETMQDRLDNSKLCFQLILTSLLSFVAGKGTSQK